MKSYRLIALINLLVLGHLSVLCVSQDFDFFYFVQQVLDFPCQWDSINSFLFFLLLLKCLHFYFSILGAVARFILWHKTKLLLSDDGKACSRFRNSWSLAKLQRWNVSVELRPQQPVRSIRGTCIWISTMAKYHLCILFISLDLSTLSWCADIGS